MPIIKRIERVYNALKDCKLSDQSMARITAKLRPDLEKIGQFYSCSPEEALFLSLIFGLKVVNSTVYYNDLVNYMDCNPFFVVSHETLFKSLQKKRLITKEDNWGRNSISLNLTREAYNAAAANKPPQPAESKLDDVYTLLQRTDNLINERRKEVISTQELLEEIRQILQNERGASTVVRIESLGLSLRETAMLLFMCYQFANGEDFVDLNDMMNSIFDTISDKVSAKRELINGEAGLVKQELVAFENDFFMMGRTLRLTDKAITELFGDSQTFFEIQRPFRPTHCRLVEAKSVQPKTLHLNESEEKQVGVLHNLLRDEQLGQVQQRFQQAGLGKGVVVLLYGEPGTGKTETVYSIAARTQRNVLLVDIANIKDKYVGESEKHLKMLFEEYRKAAAHFERTPILLFNESDALISKRIEVVSSVDQMNNSMQNILLQELETFEGILFATSNLNVNLDKAFERRFPYKIHFRKPDVATREKIWAGKLPDLDPQAVATLAGGFELTGGQIDNIVRKYLLHNILNDTAPDLGQIEQMCSEESLHGATSRIGF